MDQGPDTENGMTWVFTAGAPTSTLIEACGNLLFRGDLAWVIVPIMGVGVLRQEAPEASIAL